MCRKTVLIKDKEVFEKIAPRLVLSGDFSVVENEDEAEKIDVAIINIVNWEESRKTVEASHIFLTSPKLSDEMTISLLKDGVSYIFVKPVNHDFAEKHIRHIVGLSGTNEKKTDTRIEKAISICLETVGISQKLKGCHYLKKTILYMLDFNQNKTYTDVLCIIAENEGIASWKNIDRNIRSAIESAWIRGSIEGQYQLFGYTVNPNKGRPSNKEFIAMIAQKVTELLKRNSV